MMAYTQQDLDALRAARLSLATGRRAASVTFSDGRQIRYADATAGDLDALILAAQADVVASLGARRRPRQYRARTSPGL